jgi:hypothetical protein
MRITKSLRLLAVIAATATLACDRPSSVPYDGPYADVVKRTMPRIERSTGKRFLRAPVLEERSRDDVRAFLEKAFNTQMSAQELAGAEAAYKRFGLLPDSIDLRALLLDLLSEQVVGYYDPETDVLYVVQDASPAMRDETIQHELVHALQDQHFPLDSIQRITGDNDRRTAAQAVAEGQAMWEQLVVSLGVKNPASIIPGGWDAVRQSIREDRAGMPKLTSAPTLLKEALLFPYLSGAEHIRQFKTRRGGAWPFDSLPVSTEQVLHAEKFFDQRDDPLRLTLPRLTRRATVLMEDGLGEFETRIFFFQHLRDAGLAARAAGGWDGDRFMLARLDGGGEVLVWATVWDSGIDAAEFVDALETALPERYQGMTRRPSDSDRRRFEGAGRAVEIRAVTVDGRPVVLLTDVPAGVPATLVDPAMIRLSP